MITTELPNSASYSVICRNISDEDVYFYLYQKMPDQPQETVSVVWLISSAKVGNRCYFQFRWSEDYNFVWRGEGLIQPTKTFNMGGDQPASLNAGASTKNCTTFTVTNNTPNLSTTIRGKIDSEFTVKTLRDVPDNKYGVGIGMYAHATFLQQAQADKTQTFKLDSTYWVGARSDIKAGKVLSRKIAEPTKEVIFPRGINEVTVTFNGSFVTDNFTDNVNVWTIQPTLLGDLEGFRQVI